MTKPDERSIDARISELQALARSCSDRMMSASLAPAAVAAAPVSAAPLPVAQPAAVVAAQPVIQQSSPVEQYELRSSVPLVQNNIDPHCPDFLWREAHGRYAAPEQPIAVPDYQDYYAPAVYAPEAAKPWHKMPVFNVSLLPHFTYVGRAAAVIMLAGAMALFMATWKNSPVKAVVTSSDADIAQAVQGGHMSSDAIPSRKVTLEKIVMKAEDNGFTGAEKPVVPEEAAQSAEEETANRRVKTITLAGLTPGQFIDKSWPIPGIAGEEAAQITQIKTEQSSVELAQVEATGATNYLARGEMLLRTGDIASARLMFRKASEMGDARGAIGIASTYDPNVLRTLPVYGMNGNAKMARDWYEKAKGLGAASEATARLEALSRL